jgi:hypothetical protein
MSNTNDFPNLDTPLPNQSGLVPIISNIARSLAPSTSSPDTPPPLGTPSGGLPGGAPTGPYSPSGLGTFLGNAGSGIADLARRYFAAGQPSVWGQGAQQVDESGMIAGTQPSGAQQVDESGMTVGSAGGATSQMVPRPQTQWPPSPVKLPPAEPPPSETPPEAKRAPPRQDPYIPSSRDTRPNAWGRPDLAEQGAVRYPGLLPGPYMPQPHEWRGVMQGSTRFLGNLGSGTVAPLARLIAGLDPAYWKAKQSGDEHRAKMAAANFALYSKQLAMKQAQESRAYGDAFAAYGPRQDEKGRVIPGDEDALREAITKIAAENNDTTIPAVLARGGIPAVERLIRERDAHGKDASKVLIQMQRRNAIILQEQRIEANRQKARSAQEAQYPFLIGGGTPAAGTPGAMGAVPGTPGVPETPGGDDHEFDPHFGGKSEPAAAAPAEEKPSPEESVPTDDTTSETETPDSTDTETPDKTAERETPEQPETPETPSSPSDQVIKAAQVAITPPPSPTGTPAVTRTAARETGTVSDAPQPGQAPQAEPLPRTAEAGTPSAVPAAGTPAAMGATAPVPSLQQPSAPAQQGAIPMQQAIPGQEELPPVDVDAGAPATPSYEWQPSRSNAMARAANTVINTERGPMRPNTEMINTLAQQMVNGTIKIQDLRNYPDWVKGMARARGDEIIADMHKIAQDPNITSREQVLSALQKINPEFGAALKGYLDGNFTVPSSAWSNPGYKNRTIELGQKADPGFNEFTAKTRQKGYVDATSGKLAQNLTFTATAYKHLHHVEELLKQRPENYFTNLFKNYQVPGFIERWLGVHPEDRDIVAALGNAVQTANSEYERALVGGRPTEGARKRESEEFPLTMGRTRSMLMNIRDKKAMLSDRLTEIEGQFTAETGSQPQAMYDRFRSVRSVSRQEDMDRIRAIRTDAGSPLPTAARPTGGRGRPPAAAAADDEGAVDYRSYFGGQ